MSVWISIKTNQGIWREGTLGGRIGLGRRRATEVDRRIVKLVGGGREGNDKGDIEVIRPAVRGKC